MKPATKLLILAGLLVAVIASGETGLSTEGVVVLIGAPVLYLLPSIVGYIRGHHNRVAIFTLNLLLGWTLLGWIAALVWAATATSLPRDIREWTPQQ